MILELLAFIGLLGATGLAGSSGGSDNDDTDDDEKVDISKYFHNEFKLGSHQRYTRYWENPSTGDYWRHTINIERDDD